MRNFVFLTLTCFLWLFYTNCIFSQNNYWKELVEEDLTKEHPRQIVPNEAIYRSLDHSFKNLLLTAPSEIDVYSGDKKPLRVSLPDSDGELTEFYILSYDMMEPALAEKWNYIHNWRGWKVDDPTVMIRLDWTTKGFHAMVIRDKEQWFIDPLYWDRDDVYQVYKKSNYPSTNAFECHTTHDKNDVIEYSGEQNIHSIGDCQLRTYRLAIATTGEYTTYHGGTVAGAASAINTTLSRVNGLYESELGIRLILVANNDLLIYLNANTDPYTNDDGSTMLGENQTTLDNVIGTTNYDIGHVFSTGGGGVAYLRAPCVSNLKAGGVTGRPAPIGDPFDVDYVAHEMGHQFGATHTQNNGCNRTASTAMEPGSASTIMGYAGICAPNVQNNSDPYYHVVSISQISDYMELGGGNGCATVLTGISNTAPVVSAPVDQTIPKGTPFVLEAIGSDADNNPLTYCWEQVDAETVTMPPVGTSTGGPLFRSYTPTTNSKRYFPNLNDLINNIDSDWEELPQVGRDMNFQVTARDYNGTFGCNDTDNILLTVDGSTGPFVVNSPNANLTWYIGGAYTVTWDVAGTNGGNVNCSNVDLLLSTDGGLTYPTILAANVTNDGSHQVVLGNNIVTSTTARVMVKCSDNVFFDISNTNFTISQAQTPSFLLTTTNTAETVCVGTSNLMTEISSESIGGLMGNITFTDNGNTLGLQVIYDSNPIAVGQTTSVTIQNVNTLSVGTYPLVLTGTSRSVVESTNLIINVIDQEVATLVSPINGTTALTLPSFEWSIGAANVYTYVVEIATDLAFTNIVHQSASLSTTEYTLEGASNVLEKETTYYWRVTSQNTLCSQTSTSMVSSFQTENCTVFTSMDVPVAIPIDLTTTNVTETYTSTIEIPEDITISDLSVINLSGEHTWTGDLEFELVSPSGSTLVLISRECGGGDDFQMNFDQSSSETLECPLTGNQTLPPLNLSVDDLTIFNNESSQGIWTLRVTDFDPDLDGGQLNSWGLKVCGAVAGALPLDWLSLDVNPNEEDIELSWTTINEVDNEVFEIERMGNDGQFEKIGTMVPRNLATENRYTFIDEKVVVNKIYYYRIKQVDLDGAFTYSEIRTAKIEQKNGAITIFPNPSSAHFYIKGVDVQDVKNVVVYNAIGQKIAVDLISDEIILGFNLDKYSDGIYWTSIELENGYLYACRIVKY